MVKANGQNLTVRAEQKIAQRLLRASGVSPPVDVTSPAREYAEVEDDDLPIFADAILIYTPKGRSRPLVLLERRRPEVRRRFTLAHEFGHIAIPWHVGEMVYHEDWRGRFTDIFYAAMEAEANRFASELLMPTSWLQDILSRSRSIRDVLVRVRAARVSDSAACFALRRVLPPGYLFVEIDRHHGEVVTAGASSGTMVATPDRGRVIDVTRYSDMSSQHEVVTDGPNIIHWWRFEKDSSIPQPDYPVTSREVLANIFRDFSLVEDREKHLQHRLNGVIGSANSRRCAETKEELYAILKERFLGRENDVPLVSHPDFDLFLSLRANEIIERKRRR